MTTYNKADLQTILRENALSVRFNKKDGTIRTMLCTLKPDLLPVVETVEGEEVKKERKESETSLRVWDMEKKDWRAFRIDSIIEYSIVNG